MSGTLRVASTADIHTTSGPRLADTQRCAEFVADDGAERGVDLYSVVGDLAGADAPHESTAEERNVNDQVLQRMAQHAPVIVVEGNHESPGDLDGYGRLQGAYPIVVATRPTIFHLAPWSDMLARRLVLERPGRDELAAAVRVQAGPLVEARVYALPFPHRRWWSIAATAPLADQRAEMIGCLRTLLDAWRLDIAQAKALGIVTVFAFHGNFGGAITGGNEIIEGGLQQPHRPVHVHIGREVELSPHDVDELDVDLGVYGHIHKKQRIGARGAYSGTPAAQNHGEPDAKAYLYAVARCGGEPDLTFVPTPARRLITVDAEWRPGPADLRGAPFPASLLGQGGTWYHQGDTEDELLDAIRGAEVRLRWRVAAEYRDACPSEELADWLRAHGAIQVRSLPTTIPRQRTRLDDILVQRPFMRDETEDAAEDVDDDPFAETSADDAPAVDSTPAPVMEQVSAATAWADATTPAELLSIYWQTIGERAPSPEDQEAALSLLGDLDVEPGMPEPTTPETANAA